jgi:tRNA(fMet)-specific endonuclease VapC
VAVIIDSSVFITAERRGLNPLGLKDVVSDEPAVLATITASELLFGVHRADSPSRRTVREAFVEAILDIFPALPFDLIVARRHARLGSDLRSVGIKIGDHDLIIAATALANGYDILTDNPRDFDRVPGLVVRRPNW